MKKKNKKKTSLDDVLTVIDKWSRDNDVCFTGSFISFEKNKEADIKENRIVGFGDTGTMKLMLKDVVSLMKKEKGDFINW